MAGKRFQPGIKRNRLFTNWVVASFDVKTAPEGKTSRAKSKARVSVTGAVLVACGSVFAIQAAHENVGTNNTPATAQSSSPYSSARSPNPTDSQEECSASELAKLLAAHVESEGGDLFVRTETNSLGGIRVEKYRCRRGTTPVEYSAELIEVGPKWELKKISQLPEG